MTVSAQPVVMAFEPEGIELPMSAILPVKQLPASIKTTRKYVQIAASIAEVGIIEPPVVARSKDGSGVFLLLDGYIRVEILKDLGANFRHLPCRHRRRSLHLSTNGSAVWPQSRNTK